jgi:hypothetical protein
LLLTFLAAFGTGCDRRSVLGWVPIRPFQQQLQLGRIWAASPDDVWVGGSYEPVRVYRLNGDSLDEEREVTAAFDRGGGPAARLWGTSAQDVWVGGFLHFDGSRWNQAADGRRGGEGIWGSDPEHFYLVAGRSIFFFDGSTWGHQSDILPPLGPWCEGAGSRAIHGTSPTDIHVVGQRRLAHFDGSEWRALEEPVGGDFSDVWATEQGEAWAVGHSWPYDCCCPDPIAPTDAIRSLLIRYQEGKWREVPAPASPVTQVTACANGEVYVASKRAVYLQDRDGRWEEVFSIDTGPEPRLIEDLFCVDETLMVTVTEQTKGTLWIRR